MKKTKFGIIGAVIIIGGALFSMAVLSALNIHNAKAALVRPTVEFINDDGSGSGGGSETASSSKDVDTIKQNILLKVYYSNLNTCYESMRSPIPMSTELLASDYRYETRSGGGNYYFTSDAFNDYYMLYPYGILKDSKGNIVTHSSCTDMLSGWSSGHLWWKSSGTGILSYNRAASVPTYGGNNGEKIIKFLNDVGYDSSESSSSYADYECVYFSMNFSLSYSSWRQEYVNAGLSGMSADRSVTFETPDYCIVNKDRPYSATENQIVVLFGEWTQDYTPRTSEVSGHLKSDSNVVLAYLGSGSSPYVPSWQNATRYWANDGLDYDYETRFLEISNTNYLSLYYNPSLGKNSSTDVTSVSPNFIWTEEMCNNSKSYGFWACNYEKGAIVGPKNWRYSFTGPTETSISFTTLQERMKNYFENIQFDDDGGSPFFSNVTIHKHDPKDVEFTKRTNGVNDFVNYFLSDTSAYNSGKFTKAEQYILYHTFLTEYWNVDIKYAEPANSSEYFKIDNWLITNSSMAEYGTFMPVWIKPTTREGDDVRSLAGNLHWYSGASSSDFVQGDWRYIATVLNAIDVKTSFTDADVSDSIAGGDFDLTPTPSGGESTSGPNCFTDGSSLGWILCSTLELMGNAVNGMYNQIEGEWLEIKSGEMAVGGGVYNGWTKFRDLANIIFVIMLIIVIFSQVTGFGLTNYGIKKTLPTLIMVAILVNLSFILCQLAVDVTNILGEGLRDVFQGLQINGSGYSIKDFVYGFVVTALQLTIVGGGATALAIATGANLGMLLIPILLALLSALVGTLIFFLSLAIRKAGIFAMIVLCPVAIICYALPNTKKFFDKWLKLFTGLLMIFPVCGILMGGGQFFSSILLTSNTEGEVGFFLALTAMLIEVVPFFFIPTLVKGSLNMIGGLGAKLAGLQSRLARGAQGALSRSHWAQERQQRLNRDANMRRDSRLASKWQKRLQNLDTKRDANGELDKKNQQRYRRAEYELGRARSRSDRAMIEDMQNSVMAGREALAPGTMRYDNVMDKLKNAANDEEVEELRNSLLNKHMSYSDGGNDYDVDVNTIGVVKADGSLDTTKANARNSMSAALLHYMRQYDANPSDKSALARIRALTKQMLDAGGDAGQTAVANTLRGYTSAAGGNATRTQSFNNLTDYISRNGKWMAKLKPTDRGAFDLVSDGASSTATLKTSSEYNTAGGYAADMVPDLSDGAFDALELEIARANQSGVMPQAIKNSITRLDSTLEQAYGDPRISGRIKDSVTKRAKTIHEEAYKIERQSWLSSNSNVQKLQGKDSNGDVVNAVGTKIINGQKYLVGAGNQVLKSLYGTGKASANEAYRRQIKPYQELRTDNGPADMNVPH